MKSIISRNFLFLKIDKNNLGKYNKNDKLKLGNENENFGNFIEKLKFFEFNNIINRLI